MPMIDRRNIVLIAVIIAAGSIIGILIPYLQSKSQPLETLRDQSSNPNKASVQINYTDSGFVPRAFTVKIGSTISWLNKSSKPMWVASDPHPSHDGLPGFDDEGAILPHPVKTGLINRAYAHHPNDVYSYTFTKAGTWKYHNHIYAGDRGEIIVTK